MNVKPNGRQLHLLDWCLFCIMLQREEHLLGSLIHGDPTLVVVDVRTGFEFAGGHIQDAVPVPLHLVPFRLATLTPYRDREVVLVCLQAFESQAEIVLPGG